MNIELEGVDYLQIGENGLGGGSFFKFFNPLHCFEEILLVLHAGEVAAGELLALAHPVEGLGAVHVHRALGEHPVRLVDRRDGLVHGQVDAAERVGDLLEAAEVDRHDVIDLHVGEALDRVHGARQSAERERSVELGAAALATRRAVDFGPKYATGPTIAVPTSSRLAIR